MQHESSKVAETRAWFAKALQDLESAKILFVANSPTQWHQVLFFCQQAVEKMMKGFLVWNDTKFRWTHDLLQLGKQCTDIESALTAHIDLVKGLTDYAWEFRYPGEDPDPTKMEAKQAIVAVKKFCRVMFEHLPLEAHPTTEVVAKKKRRHRTKSRKNR